MKFDVEIRAKRVDMDRFLDVYLSERFNQEILPLVKLDAREIVEEQILPDGRERRRVKMVPKVALPGPIKKLLESTEIAYYEITVFDRESRVARFEIESDAGDRVQVVGDVRFTEEGDGVKLRFDGTVKVKVFGLGGLIERFIVSEVKKRYARVEAHMQDYLDAGRDSPEG